MISLTFLLDHSHHSNMFHIFKINKYVDKIDPLPWFLSILPAIISFHSLTMEQNFLKVFSVHAVSYFSSTINSSTHHNLAFVPNPLLKLFLSWFGKIFMLPILWTFFFAHGTWPLIWHSDHAFCLETPVFLDLPNTRPCNVPLLHWLFLLGVLWCLYLVEFFGAWNRVPGTFFQLSNISI